MLLVAVALPVQAQPAKSAAATPAATPTRTVLVMGDSLSAGYGMAASQGWVALTGDRLATRNPGWRVVNASISGETSAGGASRIQAELKRTRPSVVVIALGANDGLRGLPLEQTRGNLDRMIRAAKGARARVLLVGMRMPPNLGKAYTDGFSANYAALAKAHGVTLLPFLLEPIALDRNAYQADNLHPTAAAQPKLRDHVWKALAPLLR
jgi:acyl-CoA thioesterase-1